MSNESKEWVTIRVPEADRDDAKDIRPADATHGDCLVAGARALTENPTVTLAEDSEPDIEAIETAVREMLDDAEGLPGERVEVAGNALTYDDAKNACAAALREELPDEVLQR